MLSNFPLHTRKGRQSFETLNPLLPIFWIDRRNRSADQSIKSFIIQNQLIIANWNLPSQETIFHQYREAKVAHSSLPQLEYRIETVIFLLLFSLFFYLPLANRGGGGGERTRRFFEEAWRTIFPDIESFSARETVRSSSFGRAFGDVSLSRRILATTVSSSNGGRCQR